MTTNTNTQNEQMAQYESFFDVHRDGETIIVTCQRNDLGDYVVSLEAGDDGGWLVEDPHTVEKYTDYADALSALISMIELYVEAEIDQLDENMQDNGGSHDWITENWGASFDTQDDVQAGIIAAVTVALMEGDRQLSQPLAEYVVREHMARYPRNFIAAEAARVWAEMEALAVTRKVMTTSEIETEYNLGEGSARKAAERGQFKSARKAGGTWLVARVEAEELYGHRKFTFYINEKRGDGVMIVQKEDHARELYNSLVEAGEYEDLSFDAFWEDFDYKQLEDVKTDENLRHTMRGAIGAYGFDHIEDALIKLYTPTIAAFDDVDYIPPRMTAWQTQRQRD